jgi:hypothetical protein
MSNIISIQTPNGVINVPVVYKNNALKVVKVELQLAGMHCTYYSIVADNNMRLPDTNTTRLDKAIAICDWYIDPFSGFFKVAPCTNFAHSKAH